MTSKLPLFLQSLLWVECGEIKCYPCPVRGIEEMAPGPEGLMLWVVKKTRAHSAWKGPQRSGKKGALRWGQVSHRKFSSKAKT